MSVHSTVFVTQHYDLYNLLPIIIHQPITKAQLHNYCKLLAKY